MIWKHLGFSRDIFFVEPLKPNDEDIKLFVGRDDEIKKFIVDTLSGERALKFISGHIGVGKTTFSNACQYFSYMNSLPFHFEFEIPMILPCFEKVQIRQSDNIDMFFQKALSAICQSLSIYYRTASTSIPKEIQAIISHNVDLEIGTGKSGTNIGGSIFGFGGQIGHTTEGRTPNPTKNARLNLQNLIEVVQNDLGFKGVFVTVNNLDILTKSKLVDFFNEGRDELFDIKGVYWVFIGRKGIASLIETESDRVADYLSGTELYIPPLDFKSTRQIIDTRVKAFRTSDEIKCPLNPETISTFHYLSLKELRETLKISGEIVKRAVLRNSALKIIPFDLAMDEFAQYAYERAKDLDIAPKAINILQMIYQERSCRPKDFGKFGYSNASGFVSALKGLEQKRLLSVEEKGRARIYRMTGMTVIAAVTGALGDEIKKFAMENLRNASRISTDFGKAQLVLDLED